MTSFFVTGWWLVVSSFLTVVDVAAPTAVEAATRAPTARRHAEIHKKIDFIADRRTPTARGWDEYDGSPYTKERGYGWLTGLAGAGSDRGEDGVIIMPDGVSASPRSLGRLELAHWQGTHQENRPLVFRVDLPDGWYRVTCTSVDPGVRLPVVDQRAIKFRAHDVVFAGAMYGKPLTIEGRRLVEGSGIVEVTDGHLRIVVGDAAYGGWTWAYQGPWYRGWRSWVGRWRDQRYATTWLQKLTRTVDPGFHSLRFNSLEIAATRAPATWPVFFRDFFNRDDDRDINRGIAASDHWQKPPTLRAGSPPIESELYRTSIKLSGHPGASGKIGLIQPRLSPADGIVRYATRVSIFTGEGSKVGSGAQEAGVVILADPANPREFDATFVGVAFESGRAPTPGWLKLRVGNGGNGFRVSREIPDAVLPFTIVEGEYELVVEHDVSRNAIRHVRVNGVDVTSYFTPDELRPGRRRGAFGIRAAIDSRDAGVALHQFYWYYRVDTAATR